MSGNKGRKERGPEQRNLWSAILCRPLCCPCMGAAEGAVVFFNQGLISMPVKTLFVFSCTGIVEMCIKMASR